MVGWIKGEDLERGLETSKRHHQGGVRSWMGLKDVSIGTIKWVEVSVGKGRGNSLSKGREVD